MAVQLLLFFTAFFRPSCQSWKRHRENALVLPADDSAHGQAYRQCVRQWI